MKNAARLMTLACVGQILGYAYALPGHLDEATWSDHAQFHHVLAWIWLVGLDIAIIALACGAVFGSCSFCSSPRREATSWPLWLCPPVAPPSPGMTRP